MTNCTVAFGLEFRTPPATVARLNYRQGCPTGSEDSVNVGLAGPNTLLIGSDTVALALPFLLQLDRRDNWDYRVHAGNRRALEGILFPETFLMGGGDTLLVGLVLIGYLVMKLPDTAAGTERPWALPIAHFLKELGGMTQAVSSWAYGLFLAAGIHHGDQLWGDEIAGVTVTGQCKDASTNALLM